MPIVYINMKDNISIEERRKFYTKLTCLVIRNMLLSQW